MAQNSEIYDVTVIGAGPVGLFAVFYAGMRQMKIHLMDSLSQVGGQLAALYPEKYIYDMPGFPKVMAKDLVRDLWEQAQLGKPDVTLNEKVTKIEASGEGDARIFNIHTSGGSYFSKTIILALGIGAFHPRRLEVEGLNEREGRNVHYVLKPLDYYKDKEVLIIGGGDSALDWSLAMAAPDENGKIRCRKTVLIHRGKSFTAHEASVEQLKSTNAIVLMQNELKAISDVTENGQNRLRVMIENSPTKETQEITVDEVIVCVGYVAKLDFVKESGLTMQGSSIVVNDRMETNIPGIFAVGDVCTHEGKLKLIATGVGEAAIAANFAKTIVDPKAKAFPGHSTTKLDPNAGKSE